MFYTILMTSYSALQIIAMIGCAVAYFRSPEPTAEELERASMRSMSWPTTEVLCDAK